MSSLRNLCLMVVCLTAVLLAGCMDSSEANTAVTTTSVGVDTSLPLPTTTHEPAETSIQAVAEEPEPELTADEQLAQAFWGTWQLEDHGTRTIVVKPDGTASMHIQLDFFASLIYGEEMTMDLTWCVQDGVLTYSVVSGMPAESVERVVDDFGRERSYRVLELGSDLIQLQDTKFPGNTYDWVSVGDAAEQG